MRAHLAPAKRDAEVPEKNAPTQRAEKGRVENTAPVRIPTFFFLSVGHTFCRQRTPTRALHTEDACKTH